MDTPPQSREILKTMRTRRNQRSICPRTAEPGRDFGPPKASRVPVAHIVDLVTRGWMAEWSHTPDNAFAEALYLQLDASHA